MAEPASEGKLRYAPVRFLLPSREKVDREARRMKGMVGLDAELEFGSPLIRQPSAATFSLEGRRQC